MSGECTDDTERNYNYGVLAGGVYETRHEAVGKAAILNRDKPFDVHRVVVTPDIIGAAETLSGALSHSLQPITDRSADQ